MAKTRTILFVMPRLPFPATSGRKTSLYHYCRILSEELGYRLIVAAFLESEDDPDKKPPFIDKLVVLQKPSSLDKVGGILKDSLILRKKPMQVSLFWTKKAKEQVDNLIKTERPDLIIADMIRTTEYIKDAHAVRIADLDDRISLRYARQLDTDIDGINPYGAYLGTMPKPVQKILLCNPIKLAVVRNEIKLLHSYELEIGRKCDATVFVAKREVDTFNSELKDDKAFAIPIGVDTDYFGSAALEDNAEEYIGFLGAMNVAHNENAAAHFAKDILPLIVQKHPRAKFLVIGGGAQEGLLKLKSDHVFFMGRVDDVRDYLKKCKVFVCPMTFGSGIKTKNLEAMAMGLPVVTTSIGAENIDAESGKDWFVADSNKEFANKVLELLDSKELRDSVGNAGKRFVENCFTWKITQKQLEKLITTLSYKMGS